MGIATTTNNCYPEAPDITVNSYDVTLGGAGANYHPDVFSIGDSESGAGLVFTLSHTPVQADGVIGVLNGSVQRNGVDFTVSSDEVTMASAIATGDILMFHYLGTT